MARGTRQYDNMRVTMQAVVICVGWAKTQAASSHTIVRHYKVWWGATHHEAAGNQGRVGVGGVKHHAKNI